jgi:hypothetical protein
MTEDIKHWLGSAVDAEPPLTIDRGAVFGEGKRLVRRRRTLAAGGVAAGVVVLAAGVAGLTGWLHDGSPDSNLPPAQPPSITSDVAPPGPLLPLPPSR